MALPVPAPITLGLAYMRVTMTIAIAANLQLAHAPIIDIIIAGVRTCVELVYSIMYATPTGRVAAI